MLLELFEVADPNIRKELKNTSGSATQIPKEAALDTGILPG